MSGTAAGLILGFLASTLYGAAFHLIFGGPLRRIPMFIAAAWVGFAAGHFAGDLFGLDLLKLGAINLLSGSIGAWLALLGSLWLSGAQTHT